MADKEFTQICKEILGVSKKLEKIEPDELKKIKTDIERISEAVATDKAIFDTNKKDFDGKYNKIVDIIKTFDTLKAQIEEVLKSGVINDDTNGLISTYSSKKITDLFYEAMAQSDNRFASKTESESTYAALSQNISTLQSSLSSWLSNANNKFALKTDLEASKQDANNKFTLKTDFANYKDADGYTKLPNGLIIQWGRIGIPAGGRARVTYPIVFPNARLMLFIGSLIDAASNSNGTGGYHRPGSFDNDRTGFDVVGMYGYTASYIAIGH